MPQVNFTLTIDSANAAFDEEPEREIARILQDVSDELADDFQMYAIKERDAHRVERKVFDLNGNCVGRYLLTITED